MRISSFLENLRACFDSKFSHNYHIFICKFLKAAKAKDNSVLLVFPPQYESLKKHFTNNFIECWWINIWSIYAPFHL
jgi:hypothetical protein